MRGMAGRAAIGLVVVFVWASFASAQTQDAETIHVPKTKPFLKN